MNQFFFGQLDEHQAHLDGLWNLINSMCYQSPKLVTHANRSSERRHRYAGRERYSQAGDRDVCSPGVTTADANFRQNDFLSGISCKS